MVNPIHSSGSSDPIAMTQTPQEKQKMFDIQFLTQVLSAYVAITGQNGSVKEQLSKIKSEITAGKNPDQMATQLNLVISQINQSVVPGKVTFPPFNFSAASPTQAICNFSLSLEKLLNAAAEKGNIAWKNEEKLFSDLSILINQAGTMTPQHAFSQLNAIITEANKSLPAESQLPFFPIASS